MENVEDDVINFSSSLTKQNKDGWKMEKKEMDKLIGKQCKIVTKDTDDEKATVFYGKVMLIDHNAGFMIVESKRGTGCLNMKTIEAIKPKNKNT